MVNYKYSSAWKRFGLNIADNFLLFFILWIPKVLILFIYFPTNDDYYSIILSLLVIFGQLFYCAFFYSSKQQATPGQQYPMIKIIHEDGSRLSFSRGFYRALIDYIVYATLILGIVSVFMIIYRKKKQGIADTICKTIIVDKDLNI